MDEKELLAILDKRTPFGVSRKDLRPQESESFQAILELALQARHEVVQTIETSCVIFKAS